MTGSLARGRQSQPRRTRRGEARDALLRAHAAKLFLERGFDGVTIDDIVADVGGSKANVYSFYGGKDGLFVAAMEGTVSDLLLPLKRLKLTGLPLEAGLRKFATALLRILLQPRHLALQRLVIAEASRHPQLGLSWYRSGPSATRAILETFLLEHQSRGDVRAEADPVRSAALFHDMITYDLVIRAMMAVDGGPKPGEIDMTVRQAVRILICGIVRQVPGAAG